MPDARPDHAPRNRAAWDACASEYVRPGERAWSSQEPYWGVWEIPERELGVLPDVSGMDVVELGCGTAYWSAWLARRGARPVGVDISQRQLETARRLQRQHHVAFPLLHADAESLPLPDESFDLAISEYGAALWCDPAVWIPEAARVLRPGGLLVFLTVTPVFLLCVPERDDAPTDARLLRPYFGMRRFEWPDDDGVEFGVTYGEWIRVFRESGLAVEALCEPRPHEDADPGRFGFVTLEWARQWPHEAIWTARKAG